MKRYFITGITYTHYSFYQRSYHDFITLPYFFPLYLESCRCQRKNDKNLFCREFYVLQFLSYKIFQNNASFTVIRENVMKNTLKIRYWEVLTPVEHDAEVGGVRTSEMFITTTKRTFLWRNFFHRSYFHFRMLFDRTTGLFFTNNTVIIKKGSWTNRQQFVS